MPLLGGPYSTRMQFYRADRRNFNDTNVIFTGTATTAGDGIATIYFTDDGTAGGNSLFTAIDTAHVNVVSTSLNALSIPVSEIREINIAGKYVSASTRAFTGTTILGISVLASIGFVGSAELRFTIIGRYET